jgi:chemotaxis signal transduction protein
VGYTASSGYREYKCTDGYQNDVLALVFEKLAEAGGKDDRSEERHILQQSDFPMLSRRDQNVRLAVFSVNGELLAFDQSCVIQVVKTGTIHELPCGNKLLRGVVSYEQRVISVVDTYAFLFRQYQHPTCPYLLVVRRSDEVLVALEVDNVESILEVDRNRILSAPATFDMTSFAGLLITEGEPKQTVILLDYTKLFDGLSKGERNEVVLAEQLAALTEMSDTVALDEVGEEEIVE